MKLTKRNYFTRKASRAFLSVSQFKAFEKCQAAALAEINKTFEREKTTALLVGSYIDAYFEGAMQAFINHNPEIFKRGGGLKAEYLQADRIIERINRDALFMQYMGGEKQVIMHGTINGVDVKIKVDSLHPDKIVDLKIMRDFEPIYGPEYGRQPWFEAWQYDLQGAVYQEIVRQNTGEKLPFYLAAATKEKVCDLEIVHISQASLDFQLERFARDAPLYDAIKKGVIAPERCEACDYCKQTKVLQAPRESDEFYF